MVVRSAPMHSSVEARVVAGNRVAGTIDRLARSAGARRGEREVRGEERAAAGRALDPQLAVEDGKPIRQPDEPGPVVLGAAGAVVADPHLEGAVLHARRDRGV